MINFKDLWNKSGSLYQKYAQEFPQYSETNRKLVEIADIRESDILLDLASGTGLTTQEILKQSPQVDRIYAVDFSVDMMELAQASIHSSKVIFFTVDAHEVDRYIPEKVDVVLCNSSFRQFQNQTTVLKSLYTLLNDQGRFVFNLNQQFFDFEQPEPIQKLIVETIFSEMEKRGFETHQRLIPKTNKEKLKGLFKKTGFILEQVETIDVWPRTLDDFLSFLKIPATATFFEHVPPKKQEEILATVRECMSPLVDQIENNRRIYFVAKKIPSDYPPW